MNIRLTERGDIGRLMEIFAIARDYMRQTGNPNQWAASYPSEEQLVADIERHESHVCEVDGQIVATFVLRTEKDPTYDVIYDGAWPNDRPYATIHRIASSGEVRGIFAAVIAYTLTSHDEIRIDTHRDNRVMQHLVEQAGFSYCGIIHCWNGDERLAYQLSRKKP